MRPTQLNALDLNLLTIGDALLETASVTETAQLVHLSQPAVSRALGRLRDQLGDPLLIREGRNLVLTPYAKQLRPRLRKALLDLERTLIQPERFDPAEATGSLTLATQDYAAFAFMPSAVERLAVEAPNLGLVVVPLRHPYEPALESGECDLVIGPKRSDKSWIVSDPLFRCGWCCVARQGHPFFEEPTLDAYCAAAHLMVSPTGQGSAMADGALHQLGRARKVIARLPEFAGALALVAQSELLLVLPSHLATVAARVLPLDQAPLPFDMPAPSQVFVSWHAARSEEPRLTWARGLITHIVDQRFGPR